jgi:hypothetical protein
MEKRLACVTDPLAIEVFLGATYRFTLDRRM